MYKKDTRRHDIRRNWYCLKIFANDHDDNVSDSEEDERLVGWKEEEEDNDSFIIKWKRKSGFHTTLMVNYNWEYGILFYDTGKILFTNVPYNSVVILWVGYIRLLSSRFVPRVVCPTHKGHWLCLLPIVKREIKYITKFKWERTTIIYSCRTINLFWISSSKIIYCLLY